MSDIEETLRVFVSYASNDESIVQRIIGGISAQLSGFNPYFAPRSNMSGAYWLPQIGEELQGADAVLFIVGRDVKTWQELEYYEALRLNRELGRPNIVPVFLTDQMPGLHFLGQIHGRFFHKQSFDDLIRQLVTALQGAAFKQDDAVWRNTNPYVGLQAMGSANASYFFGREQITESIIETIRRQQQRLLMLVGNSGVGKSSLVNAGVLAALRSQIWPGDAARSWPEDIHLSKAWLAVRMRPGEQPLYALSLSLAQTWLDDPADAASQALKWVDNFKAGAKLSDLSEAAREQVAERAEVDPPTRILLYIDQCEELYARADEREATLFSDLVAEAVAHPNLIILSSLRSDFYGLFQLDKKLFDASERIDVPPLTHDQLDDVVRKPAGHLGVRFEPPEIVSAIVDSAIQESGELPLLSFLMTEAWEKMQKEGGREGVLRFPVDIVNLGRPLANRADTFLTLHAGQEETIRRLFTLRLAHVPRQGDPLRRRAMERDCSDEEWALAQKLASEDWRLLTATDGDGQPAIEVSHEAVLRKWPTLTLWLEQQHDFLVWRGQLENDLRDYESAPEGREGDAVLTGIALETARHWRQQRAEDLDDRQVDFVDHSIAVFEEGQARDARRRRRILGGSIAATVVVAIAGGVAVWQWISAESALVAEQEALTRADEQGWRAQVEQSRSLGDLARVLLSEGKPDEALAVAVAAFPPDLRDRWEDINRSADVWGPLSSAYRLSRVVLSLPEQTTRIEESPFSWDGSMILTKTLDPLSEVPDVASKIWNVETGELLTELDEADEPLVSATFSPDGKHVVGAVESGTVKVWDSGSGQVISSFPAHDDFVSAIAHSPVVDQVATASGDMTAAIWNVSTGAKIVELLGHENIVTDVSYSPSGSKLVTASDDASVRIWDASTGDELARLEGHEHFVVNASFSIDGERVVTASFDATARVWDAETGDQLAVLRGNDDLVWTADFSPDGKRIVTSSSDGSLRIWNAETGEQIEILATDEGGFHGATYSPDGRSISAIANDNLLRVWLASALSPTVLIADQLLEVSSLFITPDGSQIRISDNATSWNRREGRRKPKTVGLDIHTGELVYEVDQYEEDPSLQLSKISPDKNISIIDGQTDGPGFFNKADDAKVEIVGPDDVFYYDDGAKVVREGTFSPDSSKFVVWGHVTDEVYILDTNSGNVVLTLEGHRGGVDNLNYPFEPNGIEDLSFTKDGKKILTSSWDDGSVIVWDAETGSQILKLSNEDGASYLADIAPDGRKIVSASDDGLLRVWESWDLPTLIDQARQRADRASLLTERRICELTNQPGGCG